MGLQRNRNFYRAIASFIVVSFIITTVSVSPARATPLEAETPQLQALPANLSELSVPSTIASIQKSYSGSQDKLVIVIQDAHAIPEAQWNIKQTIDFLQQTYGIQLVAVEGAPYKLDPQIFTSFPDQQLLRALFKDYLNAGEVTADTLASIFNKHEAVYQGIEDWTLYEEGFAYFLEAMEATASIAGKLEEIENDLKKARAETYSPVVLPLKTVPLES
ncbi:MAG: hypothetical protein Q8R76_03530 [Candidatus Omnitrophota bacterium]|nr:hypothetical protein [Candidatus Omnitrophota bacterium]